MDNDLISIGQLQNKIIYVTFWKIFSILMTKIKHSRLLVLFSQVNYHQWGRKLYMKISF